MIIFGEHNPATPATLAGAAKRLASKKEGIYIVQTGQTAGGAAESQTVMPVFALPDGAREERDL